MNKNIERPTCPRCGSTGSKCRRPSGHEASAWHIEREDLMAAACGCEEVCRPWLERRAGKARKGEKA